MTIRVANRLFGDKAYTFEPSYLGHVKTAFGAPLEPVDFRTGAEDARAHINGWVAQQTQDRIKDLIPAGGVDKKTRLVLTNAIYFLGDWEAPFEKNATQPATFYTTKTDKKDVPTMHDLVTLRYAAVDRVKVLDLPYQTGALALTVVLPDAVDGLDAVEARLTPAAMDKWFGALALGPVKVSLPKFKIEPATSLALRPTLDAMGMPLAFEGDKADFTGIANPPNPLERLHVDEVFHKAFVKVDEKGTEAAAATAVEVAAAPSAVAAKPPPAAEFKADHPFLFFLRDLRSGAILFMGRLSDPAST